MSPPHIRGGYGETEVSYTLKTCRKVRLRHRELPCQWQAAEASGFVVSDQCSICGQGYLKQTTCRAQVGHLKPVSLTTCKIHAPQMTHSFACALQRCKPVGRQMAQHQCKGRQFIPSSPDLHPSCPKSTQARTLEQLLQWRVWEEWRSSSTARLGSMRSASALPAAPGTGPPPALSSNHCRNAATILRHSPMTPSSLQP